MRETDSQLVLRTLGGDNSAFDALVERYHSRAFKSAMSKVGVREEAVDIAQEAFVRAYMSLGSLNNPERFGPWLLAIVANLCKMRFRKPPETLLSADLLDDTTAARADNELDQIREVLCGLPDGTRAAAELFFIDGLKQNETAARLGISLPAVKSRIREARLRLQKEMIDMAPRSKPGDEFGDEFTSNLKHKLELARWYKTIAEHCSSGGDLMTGLQAIHEGDFSASIKEATETMISSVKAGRSVTDALGEIPALASPEASALLRAGEIFGSLHIAARMVADWMEVQNTQRDIELIFWCRTFGFLLGAGLPLTETLSYSVSIAHSKGLQRATKEIVGTLESANATLRPVMDRYPDVFPPVARLAMLAGQMAGKLDKALFWAADEMADDLARSIARGIIPSPRELSPRQFPITDIEKILPDPCIELLADHAPDIRAAAIDALGRLDWKNAAPEIVKFLDDESAEVREAAVRVVEKLGHKEAAEALIRRLKDADVIVRRAAIKSIVKLDLHSAAQALANAIEDSDYRVVLAAIESLQTLQEMDVLKRKAIEMLGGESWENQKRGAYILRYFLPREVAQNFANSLEGKPELSLNEMNAAIALGLYGCTEARSILERIRTDARVSTLAARALREIAASND